MNQKSKEIYDKFNKSIKKYENFSFSEICKKIDKWTYQELLFGFENQYITRDEIIFYSNSLLVDDIKNFDLILDIAIIEKYEEIVPMIHKIIKLEQKQEVDDINDKWLFAFVLNIYNKYYECEDFFVIIAELYDDFDAPEDMRGFIYYEEDDKHIGGIEGMSKLLRTYLENKTEKWVN